jgi:hypothetical protein
MTTLRRTPHTKPTKLPLPDLSLGAAPVSRLRCQYSPGLLSSDLQHLAAAFAVLESVHRSTGDMHKCPGQAHVGLSIAKKLDLTAQHVDLTAQHVERFIPVVAVRRRPCALVTPLTLAKLNS